MPATNKKRTRNGIRRAESTTAPQHTKGPWTVVNSGSSLFIAAPDPAQPGAIGLIAEVASVDFPGQTEANALLLSAAPGLLATLLNLDRYLAATGHDTGHPWRIEIRTAITQAEGR